MSDLLENRKKNQLNDCFLGQMQKIGYNKKSLSRFTVKGFKPKVI